MKPSAQDRIFEAMRRPETYPDPPRTVVSRETHISRVFIAGPRVYKIKKAVDLGFLDYTSLASRQYYCREEDRLNRRLSQGVYLGVVPITDDGKTISLEGAGSIVEAAVCMRRLSDERCLLRLLHNGFVTETQLCELSRVLCRFFSEARTDAAISEHGRPECVRRNCDENFEQLKPFAGTVLSAASLSGIHEAVLTYLSRRRRLFTRRTETGRIREGHGDLRTGHIYFDRGVQIIDCIEFDARYRCADTAADLAFLAMDLDAEGFPAIARDIVAAVAKGTDDPGMIALMPFYRCYRAMVRIKVSCLQNAQAGLRRGAGARHRRAISRLMPLATGYSSQLSLREMWVVCGLPGAGKSTVAAALGRALALPVLSSDVVRKEIAGLDKEARAVSPVDAGIYSAQMTAATYNRLLQRATAALSSSGGVVLDATFSTVMQRQRTVRAARASGAAVIFIHCTAPAAVLSGRLETRRGRTSISDARPEHLPRIMERFESFTPNEDTGAVVIDTTRSLPGNLIRALTTHFLPVADQPNRLSSTKAI